MSKTIAYFHSTATASSGPKINGIYRAANEKGWKVLRFDVRSTRQVGETLAYWNPDGCIIDSAADNIKIPLEAFAHFPHLCLDCRPSLCEMGVSGIVQDAESIAECAACELSQHHLMTYAYAAWPERQFWSLLRERAFVASMESRNLSVNVFRAHATPHSIDSVQHSLTEWLKTLALPVGIFTATDSLSLQVLEAAAKCGLSVPDSMMVLGVDNEEFTCETACPTLSSVDPGFEHAGRQAVEALERMMDDPKRRQIVERFKKPVVVRRTSTRLASHHDAIVIRALDFIREHATEGIGSADVLALFDCSRCLAERRFKSVAGQSILDEIHAVQIEKAKKLIRVPFQKLDAIPHLCGYSSAPFFQKLFKRVTGRTMSDWRDRN